MAGKGSGLKDFVHPTTHRKADRGPAFRSSPIPAAAGRRARRETPATARPGGRYACCKARQRSRGFTTVGESRGRASWKVRRGSDPSARRAVPGREGPRRRPPGGGPRRRWRGLHVHGRVCPFAHHGHAGQQGRLPAGGPEPRAGEAPKEPGDLLLSHIEMPLTGGHPLVRTRDPLRPPRAGFPPPHRPLPVQPAELVTVAASIATCRT